jgi:hypothetical protein
MDVECTKTEINSTLFEAVRKLAAEQDREDSEMLEDAVSYYLLFLGGLSGHEVVSEERRALARERLLELVGAGGLGDVEAQALERVMNSIRNGLGMRETEIAREPS